MSSGSFFAGGTRDGQVLDFCSPTSRRGSTSRAPSARKTSGLPYLYASQHVVKLCCGPRSSPRCWSTLMGGSRRRPRWHGAPLHSTKRPLHCASRAGEPVRPPSRAPDEGVARVRDTGRLHAAARARCWPIGSRSRSGPCGPAAARGRGRTTRLSASSSGRRAGFAGGATSSPRLLSPAAARPNQGRGIARSTTRPHHLLLSLQLNLFLRAVSRLITLAPPKETSRPRASSSRTRHRLTTGRRRAPSRAEVTIIRPP